MEDIKIMQTAGNMFKHTLQKTKCELIDIFIVFYGSFYPSV
jgi:hypothetical protein